MCLGVPGRVLEVVPSELGVASGRVDFGGVVKEVCFACTPDVRPGEYVIVHVGFAISKIDEEEARRVFELLAAMGDLEELGPAAPAPGDGS